MKKLIKEVMQWGIAFGIAAMVVSLLCFPYYRQTGWIERTGNATSAIWEPNTVLVNMVEGAGIVRVDENGYLNPMGAVLSEELVLCMGASYTQAKEVMPSESYVGILNEMLAQDEKLRVYNVSRDALFFPEMVQGVSAALSEFPQTKVLVLETGNLDFSVEKLQNALEQRPYVEKERGTILIENISARGKVKNAIKDYVPLLGVMKRQFSLMRGEGVTEEEGEIAEDEYGDSLRNVFSLMQEEFSGQIIILYHPMVTLNENGTMSIDDSVMVDVFAKCCEEYGISFVDVGDDFLEDYENHYHVPYGYSNTTMGTGHINKWGHQVIARALYDAIEEGMR